MFHHATPADEYGISEVFECREFGVDWQDDIDDEVAKRIEEVATEGLPKESRNALEIMLHNHKSVARFKIGNDGPTDTTLMRIQLDDTKTLVRVKVRRYPAGQHWFSQCISQWFSQTGIYKTRPHGPMACSSASGSKNFTKFKVINTLKPVNTTKIAEAWPMPNLQLELANLERSTCFA